MPIIWLSHHQTERSESQCRGSLSANNEPQGERAEVGSTQGQQALLYHMASRLNMGHEGVVRPIVLLWMTWIQLCLNSYPPPPQPPATDRCIFIQGFIFLSFEQDWDYLEGISVIFMDDFRALCVKEDESKWGHRFDVCLSFPSSVIYVFVSMSTIILL